MKQGIWIKITVVAAIIIVVIIGEYFMLSGKPAEPKLEMPAVSTSSAAIITYHNTQYGFDFALPDSWKGYSIVTTEWQGLVASQIGDVVAQRGPIISIRHPFWSLANPRQDIPIMVFTANQWSLLQQDQFHIGAAPINPSMLGQNVNYVFALPARYNFAFPTGYEEVDIIMQNKPLKAF